ncbi:MAG: ribonuclease HII [Muribaculaceae bacterium]|nr:ribonuclease HII [Muribaculaceae bacterium]MDE6532794.1 ribonuclease HII [Muribaculaceae bacterium]
MLKPFLYPDIIEAGCDEAGRGCLCGPVCCAAVILPPGFECPELNDSKQLSEKKRASLRPVIEREALAWAVVMVGPEEIDRINILNASITGMQRALDRLQIRPQHILVDGNRFRPYVYHAPGASDENLMEGVVIPHTTVVKGDATYMSIAAASILAKTHRDELMDRLAEEYPGYGWEVNKGYPTKAHREAIRKLGPTPVHRMSFRLT